MYTALVTDNRGGRPFEEPLPTDCIETAMKMAEDAASNQCCHHVLHICTTDQWGGLHSVAAKMVCSGRWLTDYKIN